MPYSSNTLRWRAARTILFLAFSCAQTSRWLTRTAAPGVSLGLGIETITSSFGRLVRELVPATKTAAIKRAYSAVAAAHRYRRCRVNLGPGEDRSVAAFDASCASCASSVARG